MINLFYLAQGWLKWLCYTGPVNSPHSYEARIREVAWKLHDGWTASTTSKQENLTDNGYAILAVSYTNCEVDYVKNLGGHLFNGQLRMRLYTVRFFPSRSYSRFS